MLTAHAENVISIRHRGPPRGAEYDVWREGICRSFCQLDVIPHNDEFIDCRTRIATLHTVAMASPEGASARFARTRDLLRDGCDDFVLIAVGRGAVRVTQERRTVELQAGQMCLTQMNVEGAADLSEAGAFTTTRFPREMLLQVCPAADARTARPLGENAALSAVYNHYYALCHQLAAELDIDGQKLAARHLADLAALLSGAAAEPADAARTRGLSAARLAAVKAYIDGCLGDGDLTIAMVARANGLSERQAQRLFAQAGLTFSEYVLGERLDLARRILLGDAARKISDVAWSAGFSDLSYFNRAFRRRFGATPSDMRAGQG